MNIFADMTQPSWDLDTVKYFTPFPTCGGYKQEEWYIVGGESQVVGPICEYEKAKRDGFSEERDVVGNYSLHCRQRAKGRGSGGV